MDFQWEEKLKWVFNGRRRGEEELQWIFNGMRNFKGFLMRG